MGAVCCGNSAIDFNEEVCLAHFDLLRCVGKGAFGKVRIVQHKAIKKNYALKYINKEKCIRMKAIDNIIQERRILEEIKFPLICNLRYAFQDDENMFMVLDLMLGGDLRFHVDRKGALSEEVIRLWAAEIFVSLHYLHSKRIVHRDIKPDNVLLDSEGHAHLTDFNIAVRIKPGKKLTSVAGSLAYMAPEILQRMGYSFSVDWWSTGVLLYEMLYGHRPFRAKSNDELARLILSKPMTCPEKSITGTVVSAECKQVIMGLCERSIHKRLGYGATNYRRLISHPWFAGLDWDQVAQKAVKPLFVPDAKHSNFDATHELEELLMEDTPLRVNNRSRNPNKPLTTEMQKIETEFTVYDHTRIHLPDAESAKDGEKSNRIVPSSADIGPAVRHARSSCSTKGNTAPTDSTTQTASVQEDHLQPYTSSTTPAQSQTEVTLSAYGALPSIGVTPPKPPAPTYDPLRTHHLRRLSTVSSQTSENDPASTPLGADPLQAHLQFPSHNGPGSSPESRRASRTILNDSMLSLYHEKSSTPITTNTTTAPFASSPESFAASASWSRNNMGLSVKETLDGRPGSMELTKPRLKSVAMMSPFVVDGFGSRGLDTPSPALASTQSSFLEKSTATATEDPADEVDDARLLI
ncbi:hypothetical protein IWQ60_011518 [Tieghemiomyces parasiticus]|uniref:Uncharacterized protein n=1 Tax=Tieghemiomyces parasiticus TaxID=78921 RepID=A0A9W8DLK2_9FUNG|nr:hypothetical protein IWQ60_011518 [Tieghemiomyces parasiticus]